MSDLLNRSEAKLAGLPALLTGDDGVLFANADWTVSTEGLEHRNGYFIEREALAQRHANGAWMWPLHMAEKLWSDPESFGEAFGAALQAYGLGADAGLPFVAAASGVCQVEMPPVYDLRLAPSQRQAGRSDVRRAPVAARHTLAEAA